MLLVGLSLLSCRCTQRRVHVHVDTLEAVIKHLSTVGIMLLVYTMMCDSRLPSLRWLHECQ